MKRTLYTSMGLMLVAVLFGACSKSSSPSAPASPAPAPAADTATFTFTATPTPTGTWFTPTSTSTDTPTSTATNSPTHSATFPPPPTFTPTDTGTFTPTGTPTLSCPYSAAGTIVAGTATVVTGNTCSGTHRFSCGMGCPAPDILYILQVVQAGTVVASTCGDGQTWASNLLIRSDCGDESAGILAESDNYSCGNRSVVSVFLQPGTYALVVDSPYFDDVCGSYTLTVSQGLASLTPTPSPSPTVPTPTPTGSVFVPNTPTRSATPTRTATRTDTPTNTPTSTVTDTPTDTPTVTRTGTPTLTPIGTPHCGVSAIDITDNVHKSGSYEGSTLTETDDFEGDGCGTGARDQLLVFTVEELAAYSIGMCATSEAWPACLYLRTSCEEIGTTVAVSADTCPNKMAAIDYTLLQPGTYYLIVDGQTSSDSGNYFLTFDIAPPGEIPTLTPTPTRTFTFTRTWTFTPSPTSTRTLSPTPTPTPSPTSICGASAPSTFGSASRDGGLSFSGTETLFSSRFALSDRGEVKRMMCWATSAGMEVRMGVYADVSGQPGSLLVQSSGSITCTGGAWNTIELPTIELQPGNYWLALKGRVLSGTPRPGGLLTTGGGYYFGAQAWGDGSLPATYPVDMASSGQLAVQALYCVLPTLTPTPTVTATPTVTLTPYTCSSPVTLGAVDFMESASGISGTMTSASLVNLSTAGGLYAVQFYTWGSAGYGRFGFYTTGSPATLVAQTGVMPLPVTATDTVHMIHAPLIPLAAGNYYLVFMTRGDGVSTRWHSYRLSTGEVRNSTGLAWGELPATLNVDSWGTVPNRAVNARAFICP